MNPMAQTQGLERGRNVGPQAVVEAVNVRSDNYRISVITHVEERPVRSGQQGASARLEGLMSRVCQAGRADCRLASKVYRGQERAKQDWGPR